MDFTIPEELETLRRTVRRFVDEELRPLEQGIDEAEHVEPAVLRALRRKSADIGLYAHNLPVECGGGGLSMLGTVVVGEELGRTSMPLNLGVGGFLPEMLTLARPDQRPWFLDPLVSGEKVIAYAMTEPDAGSDLGGLKTRALREGNAWVLNGAKQFVSLVDHAEFIVVLAVTDPAASLKGRFTCFIVDRENPGFRFLRNIKKMGWRGSHFCAFALDDCRVGDEAVLGEVGGGFAAIMGTVNRTRIQAGACWVGMAEELQQQAVAHAKQRRTFGQLLGEHQAIQFMLADNDVEIEAARLLVYRAADAVDRGQADARIGASRVKYYCAEMVNRVADRVLQIFGAAGYSRELTIERMYRDARAYRIGEGSSEMQKIQIARHLLGGRS